VGWQVADQLLKNSEGSIKVLTAHQLMPELAEPISEADLVIFVDACYDGQPGSWQCEPIEVHPVMPQAFAHYFTPMSLLGYANSIFNARPEGLLISVAAGSFDCGETLTPGVAGVVPELVCYICAILEESQTRTRQCTKSKAL
jgi:hydrogenase maturation protease